MNIVIASILKPLDDVRHFQKLGLSLAKIPNSKIHILGRAVEYPLNYSNVRFHPVYPTKNKIGFRLIAPWKAFVYFIKVKPKVIVSCTYELLIVIILYKILFGTKIVYDVQENYTKNIACNTGYGALGRKLGALYIKAIEAFSRPFIHQYWLAEACYRQEMPWVNSKSLVLENKSLFFRSTGSITLSDKPIIHLLYSGTIAAENGIFEAIELISALHKLDERYQLTIVGCCHQTKTAAEIEKLILQKKHFIHLIISNIPIQYKVIQENVLKADIGIICYRKQENFNQKIPTKLFEYTTAGLPILLQQNPTWVSFCEIYNNTIVIDYQNINSEKIHKEIQNSIFYPNGNDNASKLSWASEETRLTNEFIHVLYG